jgi:hypothetical protein
LSTLGTRIGKAVWVLIYAGMACAGLGIALQRNGSSGGWPVTALGLLGIAIGIVLIWVRSRLPDDGGGA